jgi:hypothetical protein
MAFNSFYFTSNNTPNLSQAKDQLTNAGNDLLTAGQGAYQQGLSDFGPALDYWNSILSGNKAQMENAIAPEKDDILSQYRAKRKQLAATGSRSGGTNESVAQSEFSQAGDVASLLQKLRPQAAKESSDIAGKIGSMGLQESDMGMQALAQMLQAGVTERGQTISILNALL